MIATECEISLKEILKLCTLLKFHTDVNEMYVILMDNPETFKKENSDGNGLISRIFKKRFLSRKVLRYCVAQTTLHYLSFFVCL